MNAAEPGGIDGAVAKKRREHDRRPPDHLAMNRHEPARQVLGLALQQHLGEQQMRGAAADVDADGRKLDILLPPDELRDCGALLIGHREMFVEHINLVHEAIHSGETAPSHRAGTGVLGAGMPRQRTRHAPPILLPFYTAWTRC